MSGVYMVEKMYCPDCDRETDHDTQWESEDPNRVFVDCKACNPTGRARSGLIRFIRI